MNVSRTCVENGGSDEQKKATSCSSGLSQQAQVSLHVECGQRQVKLVSILANIFQKTLTTALEMVGYNYTERDIAPAGAGLSPAWPLVNLVAIALTYPSL